MNSSESPPLPSLPNFERKVEMSGMMSDPHMDQFSLDEASDNSYSVSSLDKFLCDIYQYHQSHGFLCSILKDLLEILTFFFVLAFLVFLTLFIDYDKLLDANNSNGRLNFWTDIVRVPSGFNAAYVFFGLLGIYLVYKVAFFFYRLPSLFRVRDFYHNYLKISEAALQHMSWDSVVSKVIKIPRLCRTKENWNQLDVANRIMRHENYFTVLMNRGIVDFDLSIFSFVPTGDEGVRFQFATNLLGDGLRRMLRLVLWQHEDDDSPTKLIPEVIRAKHDPEALAYVSSLLRWHMRVYGILSIVLFPFVFVYMTAYYLFKFGNEFRAEPSRIGSRIWSTLARWKLREINELDHAFDARLLKGIEPARAYMDQFKSYSVNIIARFLSFLVGSLILGMLFLALWTDDLLTDVDFAPDKSGLWTVGILGALFAVFHSFVFDENFLFDPAKHLKKASRYTHFLPERWIGTEGTTRTKAEFGQLLSTRLIEVVTEIFGLFLAPIFLLYVLPKHCDGIVLFYSNSTYSDSILGDMCVYGDFTQSLAKYGDEDFGGKAGVEVSLGGKLHQGKLERSFIGFMKENPSWAPPSDGVEVVENLLAHSRVLGLSNDSSLPGESNRREGGKTISPPFQLSQPFEDIDPDQQSSSHSSSPLFLSRSMDGVTNLENLYDLQTSFYMSRRKSISGGQDF
jgi:autophagy-related protein 9